jgi:hypothetical protein
MDAELGDDDWRHHRPRASKTKSMIFFIRELSLITLKTTIA